MKIEELPQDSIVLIHDADNISYAVSHEIGKWGDSLELCDSVINDYMNNLLSKVGATHYLGFLGGIGNFRYEIAKTKPYKANRGEKSERDKKWKQYINEYLVQHWNLVKVDDIESDDAVSIAATRLEELGINYLIASNDKDLNQITGNHCNNDISGPKNFYYISEWDACINLANQMILGDSTDNIPGIPGIGKVGAHDFLYSFNEEKNVNYLSLSLGELYSKRGLSNEYFKEQLGLLSLLTHYPPLDLEFHSIDRQKLASYKSKSEEIRINLVF